MDEWRTAADRYRIEVTRGSVFASLVRGGRASKRGPSVSIVNETGQVVWRRVVPTQGDVAALVELIQTQVLTARLEDFEHWLRTDGAAGRP